MNKYPYCICAVYFFEVTGKVLHCEDCPFLRKCEVIGANEQSNKEVDK